MVITVSEDSFQTGGFSEDRSDWDLTELGPASKATRSFSQHTVLLAFR